MINSFPPLINDASRVLLLGTMPGVESLNKQEYYGYKSNQFWKIIFSLFNEPLNEATSYDLKTQLLLNNKIALWDVLKLCSREGSADNTISGEVVNDFDLLYTSYPNISYVFFTSRNAEKYYSKLVGKRANMVYHTLPSPSTAYARISIEQKAVEWKLLTNVVSCL